MFCFCLCHEKAVRDHLTVKTGVHPGVSLRTAFKRQAISASVFSVRVIGRSFFFIVFDEWMFLAPPHTAGCDRVAILWCWIAPSIPFRQSPPICTKFLPSRRPSASVVF